VSFALINRFKGGVERTSYSCGGGVVVREKFFSGGFVEKISIFSYISNVESTKILMHNFHFNGK
jgi:hypothetical protein